MKHLSAPRFRPELEGLRAVAALGVAATHVAFQTGVDPRSTFGAIAARADFFVPVFFALSAFLLYQRPPLGAGAVRAYYRRRIVRLYPAYLITVVATLLLLPEAFAGSRPLTVAATALFGQIFVPNGLLPGLTHLWSLSVEVAFYLALPLIVLLPRRVILALTVASLAWPFLPFVAATPANGWPNLQIAPPAFLPWFFVGIAAAWWMQDHEHGAAGAAAPARAKWASWLPLLGWPAAVLVMWVAGQEWYGPVGLVHPSAPEFLRRVLAGTLFAALMFYPVLVPGTLSRLLSTPPVQFLGKISYGIFLWHLPVLSLAFSLAGRPLFSGGFWQIYAITIGFAIPIAWLSFTLVEEPARRAWRGRRHRRPAGEVDQ